LIVIVPLANVTAWFGLANGTFWTMAWAPTAAPAYFSEPVSVSPGSSAGETVQVSAGSAA